MLIGATVDDRRFLHADGVSASGRGQPEESSRLPRMSGFEPPLHRFGVRSLGEPLDRAESSVPLRGKFSHGSSGLVKAVALDLVENLSTLFAAADQSGVFEHDQMFGDRLAGEGYADGQPAGAGFAAIDEKVENSAT